MFEKLDYPIDVIWLDIDHTDGMRYFTVSTPVRLSSFFLYLSLSSLHFALFSFFTVVHSYYCYRIHFAYLFFSLLSCAFVCNVMIDWLLPLYSPDTLTYFIKLNACTVAQIVLPYTIGNAEKCQQTWTKDGDDCGSASEKRWKLLHTQRSDFQGSVC